ncbi:hypothetical protein RCL1_007426 [Eukaryota sp. TZLM3-RCL]
MRAELSISKSSSTIPFDSQGNHLQSCRDHCDQEVPELREISRHSPIKSTGTSSQELMITDESCQEASTVFSNLEKKLAQVYKNQGVVVEDLSYANIKKDLRRCFTELVTEGLSLNQVVSSLVSEKIMCLGPVVKCNISQMMCFLTAEPVPLPTPVSRQSDLRERLLNISGKLRTNVSFK